MGFFFNGLKMSMNSTATNLNSQLKLLEYNVSCVDLIDDSGNIVIQQGETFPMLAQGIKLKAKKLLRTLKFIAAVLKVRR